MRYSHAKGTCHLGRWKGDCQKFHRWLALLGLSYQSVRQVSITVPFLLESRGSEGATITTQLSSQGLILIRTVSVQSLPTVPSQDKEPLV